MGHEINLVQQNSGLFPMKSKFLFLIVIYKQVCDVQKYVPISEEMGSPQFQVLYLITI